MKENTYPINSDLSCRLLEEGENDNVWFLMLFVILFTKTMHMCYDKESCDPPPPKKKKTYGN